MIQHLNYSGPFVKHTRFATYPCIIERLRTRNHRDEHFALARGERLARLRWLRHGLDQRLRRRLSQGRAARA